VSGVVVGVGAPASDAGRPGLRQSFAVGDAVCGLVNGGGYAEFVTLPATQAMRVPRGVSMRDAAAVPETAFTVWHNVFQRGRLGAGETLFVHGGSGGIGVYFTGLMDARDDA
jgi:NADPH:quinone reductase-like Zn-dependent oxidoreductase